MTTEEFRRENARINNREVAESFERTKDLREVSATEIDESWYYSKEVAA